MVLPSLSASVEKSVGMRDRIVTSSLEFLRMLGSVAEMTEEKGKIVISS